MPGFLTVAVRDCVIAAITLALLALDASYRAAGTDSALAIGVGAMGGAMVTLSAFLAHEWGHLVGALASGGRAERPPRLSPYLFFFDTARSTRAQFLWMSAGGYVATAICVAAIIGWAELGSISGVVALGLTAIGVTVTLVLEIPTTVRVWRGAALPTGGVYTS